MPLGKAITMGDIYNNIFPNENEAIDYITEIYGEGFSSDYNNLDRKLYIDALIQVEKRGFDKLSKMMRDEIKTWKKSDLEGLDPVELAYVNYIKEGPANVKIVSIEELQQLLNNNNYSDFKVSQEKDTIKIRGKSITDELKDLLRDNGYNFSILDSTSVIINEDLDMSNNLKEAYEPEELDAIKLQHLSDEEILDNLRNASEGTKLRNLGYKEGSWSYDHWGDNELRVSKHTGYQTNAHIAPAWMSGSNSRDRNKVQGQKEWWEINGSEVHEYDLLRILKGKDKYYQVRVEKLKEDYQSKEFTMNKLQTRLENLKDDEIITLEGGHDNFGFNIMKIEKNKKYPKYFHIWNEDKDGNKANEVNYSDLDNILYWAKKYDDAFDESLNEDIDDYTYFILTVKDSRNDSEYKAIEKVKELNTLNTEEDWKEYYKDDYAPDEIISIEKASYKDLDLKENYHSESEEEEFENTIGATSRKDAKKWLNSQLEEYGNTYFFPSDVKAELNRLITDFGSTYFWNRADESLNEDYPESVVDTLVDKYSIYYHPVEREKIKTEIINLTGNSDIAEEVVDELDANFDRVNLNEDIHQKDGINIYNDVTYRWRDDTNSNFEYHSFISGLSDYLKDIMWDGLNEFKIQIYNMPNYVELEVVPQNEEVLLGENTYPFDDVFTGEVLNYIEDTDKIYFEATNKSMKKELEDIEKNILPKVAKEWGFRKVKQ